MTVRAIVVGLALGLLVAAATHFNDFVIFQTFLIGNHLPIGVFGVVAVLVVVGTPVLVVARLGRVALRGGEVAVVTAVALAACGWPGSNLFRVFNSVLSRPATLIDDKPSWRSTNAFSYVPGGSPLLAEGYVTDWGKLVLALHRAEVDAAPSPGRQWWGAMSRAGRLLVREAAAVGRVEPARRGPLVRALNEALERRPLYDEAAFAGVVLPEEVRYLRQNAAGEEATRRDVALLNRVLMERAFAGVLRPMPPGDGVLLHGGEVDRLAHETPLRGWQAAGGEGTLWPWSLPWSVWWPTLRLWGGLALLMGVASLCLALIVHPQWAHRELLLYPTVRVVRELVQHEPDAVVPSIARRGLFWLGLGGAVGMHTINGLHGWFEQVPEVTRSFDLRALQELFPNAARVPGSYGLFYPTVYLSVVGFGFLIHARVSASLFSSLLLWVMLGALLAGAGVTFNTDRFTNDASAPALRVGSYLAATLMILYFGRRHYGAVAAAAVGRRRASVPPYCVGAARGLVLCVGVALFVLRQYAGLSLLLGAVLIALVLMVWLVLARINAETGLFYAQPDWLPAPVIAGVLGLSGVGPEALIVLVFASIILVVDPREAVMPYLTNGLKLADAVGQTPPPRFAPWLVVMLVASFLVALLVTFTIQYNLGFSPRDGWANQYLINAPFDRFAGQLQELAARSELVSATGRSGLDHLWHMDPSGRVWPFLLAGFALFLACSVARLRLTWWPLHPVAFLVWGTYPMNHMAFSFLLAAVIKASVVRSGGEQAFRRTKPLMIGLIAGELLAALLWIAVGATYFFVTGSTPPAETAYRILPG